MRLRPLAVSVSVALALTGGLLMAPTAVSATQPTADQTRDLRWHDCPRDLRGWECATLVVPLDWDDPTNPATASIELAVHRATGPAQQRLGALTFNPGGPGVPGLDLATYVLESLPTQIQRRFDVVAWDPRGVGRTRPKLTNCPTPESMATASDVTALAEAYELPATGPVDWRAFAERLAAETSTINGTCLERNPEVAPYLGTHYVVRDLEAMREALGEPNWTFWGMSYGSRLGYRYARTYPDRVRALLLDGSWPPNLTVQQWAGMDTWSWVYGQEVFAGLQGPRMTAKFTRVIRGLNRRTVTLDGKEWTRWDVLPSLFIAISEQQSYPFIAETVSTLFRAVREPRSVSAAEARRFRVAMERLSDMRQQLDMTQQPSASDTSELLTINFVNCADMSGRPAIDQVAAMATSAYDNGSPFGALLVTQKGTFCSGLPQDLAPPFPRLSRPLRLPTPPVIVQSIGDTRTPWLGGQTMAGFMTRSSLITYTSTQHVSYLFVPSTCINRPVTNYILTQRVPSSRTCPYAPSK